MTRAPAHNAVPASAHEPSVPPGAARKASAADKRLEAASLASLAAQMKTNAQDIVDSLHDEAVYILALESDINACYMWGGYSHNALREKEGTYLRLSAQYDRAVKPARDSFNNAASFLKKARRLKWSARKDALIGYAESSFYKVIRPLLSRASLHEPAPYPPLSKPTPPAPLPPSSTPPQQP